MKLSIGSYKRNKILKQKEIPTCVVFVIQLWSEGWINVDVKAKAWVAITPTPAYIPTPRMK